MHQLYSKICNFVGLRLFTLGAQLCGYTVVVMYQPAGDPHIRAMHVAEDPTQLNNSMRTYVEDLDASYVS